jgi:hypothetical protein
VAAKAFSESRFVSAEGSLFYEDYDLMHDELAKWMKALKLYEQSVPHLGNNKRAKERSLFGGKSSREADNMVEMVKLVLGPTIECGVRLGGASGIAVRGILNKEFPREPAQLFVDRYGGITSVQARPCNHARRCRG